MKWHNTPKRRTEPYGTTVSVDLLRWMRDIRLKRIIDQYNRKVVGRT